VHNPENSEKLNANRALWIGSLSAGNSKKEAPVPVQAPDPPQPLAVVPQPPTTKSPTQVPRPTVAPLSHHNHLWLLHHQTPTAA